MKNRMKCIYGNMVMLEMIFFLLIMMAKEAVLDCNNSPRFCSDFYNRVPIYIGGCLSVFCFQ